MMHALVAALLLELAAASHVGAGWNQWTNMGPGGDVIALAIDPVTPRTIYAARGRPGPEVFKSTDGGAHWTLSTTGLTAPFVTALAVDVQTPTTVYAGVNGADVWGVFKSADGGAHWHPSHAGFPPIIDPSVVIPRVNSLVVDPQNPATVYAGTSVGVFKSTDGGAFWGAQNTGLFDQFVTALAVDPRTPSTLYVATLDGVFKSTNGGAQWTISDDGLPHVFIFPPPQALPSVFALTVDPYNSATLYAGTIIGVFKSTDGGANWNFSMTGVHFIGSGVSAVAVDPQTPGVLYAATFGAGIYKSTDGGESWTPFSAGLDGYVTGLQVSPSGACLHAAASVGVYSLVTRPDPCASPVNLSISVNQPSFEMGQTLTASVGLLNLGDPGAADIYLGILIPDGNYTTAFFTGADSFAFGTLDDFTSFRPVATGVPLALAFATTVPDFFSHRWTGAELPGDYAFIFYAVRAGALADGILTADEVLAYATTRFSFSLPTASTWW